MIGRRVQKQEQPLELKLIIFIHRGTYRGRERGKYRRRDRGSDRGKYIERDRARVER